MKAEHFAIEWRAERGEHEHIHVRTKNGTIIQIAESPGGRSVQVFIGAERVWPR